MVADYENEKILRVKALRGTMLWFLWLQPVKPGGFGSVGMGEQTRSPGDF